MGTLCKHTSEYTQKRSQALLWWKKLSRANQLEAIQIWQESLPMRSLGKDWSYPMVANSDSTIQRIYEYLDITQNH